LTVAPLMAVKVMGASGVPATESVTLGYTPGSTMTVWPGWTALAAAAIVHNGWLWEPAPLSEQFDALALST
jgi:hypothetical protein